MVGDNIKQLRIQNNLSQQQIADLLKVNRSSISHWETGLNEPGVAIIVRLKQILNCTYEELLED
jgi:transcriptional regulator with XRE-family HTH domain